MRIFRQPPNPALAGRIARQRPPRRWLRWARSGLMLAVLAIVAVLLVAPSGLVALARATPSSLRVTRRDRAAAAGLALAIKAAGLTIPARSLLLAWSAVPAAGSIVALTPEGSGWWRQRSPPP